MSTRKTLKINPELFKLNGARKKHTDKSKKSRPIVERAHANNINKVKKEMLKRVKNFQKNNESNKIKEEKTNFNQPENANNLFENNEFSNPNFEREFNNSLNFLQDLAKKNKEKKKKKNQTLKTSSPNIKVNINLPTELEEAILKPLDQINQPSYGCLKSGNKPTFRQLHKTQKNTESGKPKIKIVLDNNVYFDSDHTPGNIHIDDLTPAPAPAPAPAPVTIKPQEFNEIIENKIDNLKISPTTNHDHYDRAITELDVLCKEQNELSNISKTIDIVNPVQIQETNDSAKAVSFSAIENSPNNEMLQLKNIPKIHKVTKTFKYKLGKKPGSNTVGILIKNRETQKRIKQELGFLKQKSIQEIKNHLRENNLIKTGTQAPTDVLRKLYEESILAGEVTNSNNNNLLYNYLND